MVNYLKIVVAGEIDAGKSTLIGRFLYEMGSIPKETVRELENTCQSLGRNLEFAYLLDSFEEERMNQLTIDTTQAFCENKKGKGFLFIDVPGHRELLRNMLCGSSDADTAILVIDAGKSVEEGTLRHSSMLKFLGIEEVICIFNKMDYVNFDQSIFLDAKKKAIECFKKIGIKPTYFIPICAKQGDNLIKRSQRMSWYKGLTVLEALNKQIGFREKENSDFYFPIQDVYNIGQEHVFVGNIVSGRIKAKEMVKISPLDRSCRIKQIKAFDKVTNSAKAGESVGLVLNESDNLRRGQVIYKGKPPQATNKILAKIICVQPLNPKERLIFKCATQETFASITQINNILDTARSEVKKEGEGLKEGDAAEVSIVTDELVSIKKFSQINSLGRFVLQKDGRIYAAGIVL
jgi:small GTP-binding protein